MAYANKDERINNVKSRVEGEFYDLHPTDRAEAFGKLSEWAEHRYKARGQINARDGVPERSEANGAQK